MTNTYTKWFSLSNPIAISRWCATYVRLLSRKKVQFCNIDKETKTILYQLKMTYPCWEWSSTCHRMLLGHSWHTKSCWLIELVFLLCPRAQDIENAMFEVPESSLDELESKSPHPAPTKLQLPCNYHFYQLSHQSFWGCIVAIDQKIHPYNNPFWSIFCHWHLCKPHLEFPNYQSSCSFHWIAPTLKVHV